jgi:16S rRNA G1207 methylase RsmC
MFRIVDFSHHTILENFKDGDTLVDMTCGNGNDTQFLEKHFPNSKIFAFDTQEEAIQNTKEKVENVTVIHDTHINIKTYVSEADMVLFNLGYLPGGDETITTNKNSTVKAIKESLDVLNKNGLIIIVIYIGHIEGYEESIYVDKFCNNLDNRFDVFQYKLINKKDAPYVNIIRKK